MAKNKKRSKKTKLSKKFDKKLLKDVVVFLFFVLAFYTVMYVTLYSGGSRECALNQEIETGCNAEMPLSMILLLPALVLAGAMQAGIKRLHDIKRQAKKAREALK